MKLYQPTKRYQAGISAVETLLVVLVVVMLSVTGLVLYQRHKDSNARNNTATSPSQTASQQKSNTTTKSNALAQVTPTAFVSGLLRPLTSGDESQLEQLLTPAFKSFRQQRLAAGPCNYPPKQSLVCDSLLEASTGNGLTSLSPTITDFTFKNGQKGKRVTYQLIRGGSGPGTTYFTFYLLPRNNSWLLNDYMDVFVPQVNASAYSPLPGEMEEQGQ